MAAPEPFLICRESDAPKGEIAIEFTDVKQLRYGPTSILVLTPDQAAALEKALPEIQTETLQRLVFYRNL